MDVYIDIYIDFFLVFTWSHIKCKQHKASHNIIIAGPGPMRPRGPCKAKQVKAMQRNTTSHLFPYPYPQKPLQVTPFPLAVLQNLLSDCGVAKPSVLQNPMCC